MWNDANLYYNPEKLGFQTVDSLETKGESYQFDIVLVLRDVTTGEHFWCQDSGCSCPTPFENHSRESLERLTLDNWGYFENTVKSSCQDWNGVDSSDFLRTVERSLRAGWMLKPLASYRKT